MNETLKKIIGFLFTALAGWLGYESAPDMAVSFSAVVAAVYLLTNLVKKHTPAQVAQILSWIVGIAFALLAWVLNLGIFADFNIYFAAVTGFMASLAANGIYDSAWIEAFWKLISKPLTEKK